MKEILKGIKLNESIISMILGALVVLITGALLISNFRNQQFNATTIANDIQQVQPDVPSTDEDIPVSDIVVEEVNSEMYTVAEGDSLWKIAEKFYGTGYEWTEIAKANPNVADGKIEVGQKITVPDTNKILDEAASTTAEGVTDSPDSKLPAPEVQPEDVDHTYTVQRGDNLWNIAVEVYGDGYRWTDISEANNLANPHIIHSGNVFKLPS